MAGNIPVAVMREVSDMPLKMLPSESRREVGVGYPTLPGKSDESSDPIRLTAVVRPGDHRDHQPGTVCAAALVKIE